VCSQPTQHTLRRTSTALPRFCEQGSFSRPLRLRSRRPSPSPPVLLRLWFPSRRVPRPPTSLCMPHSTEQHTVWPHTLSPSDALLLAPTLPAQLRPPPAPLPPQLQPLRGHRRPAPRAPPARAAHRLAGGGSAVLYIGAPIPSVQPRPGGLWVARPPHHRCPPPSLSAIECWRLIPIESGWHIRHKPRASRIGMALILKSLAVRVVLGKRYAEQLSALRKIYTL